MKRLLVLSFCWLVLSQNSAFAAEEPYIYGASAILIDADTGTIYFEQDSDVQVGIASMTKLMTIYIVYDEVAAGTVSWEDEVIISEKASEISYNPALSNVPLEEGQSYPLSELVEHSLILSANGATIAIAEMVSGSEEKHVEKMNAKSEELGLSSTIFYNVTGLTDSDYGDYSENEDSVYNVSTAQEVACIAYNLVQDYPEILEITSKSYVDWNGEPIPNYNLMLPDLLLEYPGVKGLKTGSSDESGFCFAGYITINEKNYISVVTGTDSSTDRFYETEKLYDWISEEQLEVFISKGYEKKIDLWGSKLGQETLVVAKDYYKVQDESIHAYNLVSIEYNQEYFNERNKQTQTIPESTLVLTVELKSESESSINTSVESSTNSIYIDLYSSSSIRERGPVRMILEKAFKLENY